MLVAIVLIVYGSLYPWHFKSGVPDTSPFTVLLDSYYLWTLDRFTIRDILLNVAIYMPVGLLACLALLRRAGWLLSVVLPILLGFVVSLAVELAQVYTERTPSVLDLISNTAGAAAGVGIAIVFHKVIDTPVFLPWSKRVGERDTIALLLCWFAFMLSPLIPVLGRAAVFHKIQVFRNAPVLPALPFVSALTAWFLIGCLLAGLRYGGPINLAVVAAGSMVAQFFVINRQPYPSDVLGAAVAIGAFTALSQRKAVRIGALMALALLILRGVAPFRVDAAAHDFTWIPFGGVLESQNWQRGSLILLEKTFYSGAAIWSLRRSGVRLVTATAIPAVTLACVEALQTHLAGRTPEITDPLLALLLGFMFRALETDAYKEASSPMEKGAVR